jgi:6,7-dimethyl-8-ribityllumazine synthase
MSLIEADVRASDHCKIAVLASRWNPSITDALVMGACACLKEHGLSDELVDIVRVPGAWEIPLAANALAASKKYHAIIALGCVVRGDTRHYEHVADECARGLMDVALKFNVPVCNGVLAVEDYAHAQARAGGSAGNKGEEVALAALEMVNLMGIIKEKIS